MEHSDAEALFVATYKALNRSSYEAAPHRPHRCERCRRYTPWNVPGVEICGRCRDVGIEDGWLVYDEQSATFSRVSSDGRAPVL